MIELLAQHNETDSNEISLGFHMPPFNSVKHIHLHGIAPKREMRFFARWIFKENTLWFKSIDDVILIVSERE
jgi:Scavenger mRNA decapping enzyme C-term binding